MKSITSRLVAIAMLMLAMTLVLAACGGEDEPTATPTSAPTTGGGTSPDPTPTPGEAMDDDPTPTPATGGGGTGPTGPAATPTPTLTVNEQALQAGARYLTYDLDWQVTPQVEALIPLAQAEGEVHFTAYGQDHVDAVCPAFEARFNIKCGGRGIGAGQIVGTLSAEREAGEAPTDVIYLSGTHMAQYIDKGYGAEVDWASLGADARRAWDAAGDTSGNALAVAQNQYTNFYSTDEFTIDDLPKTVYEWLDPKYNDLVCAPSFLFRAGNGFMAFRFDADEMIDVHKRMIDEINLFITGNCNEFILSGEKPLVYMGYGNPPALLDSGFIGQFWNTGMGINVFNTAVASNAPHPNAARLFAAWHQSREVSQITWDAVGSGWAAFGNAAAGLLAGGDYGDVEMVFEGPLVARQRGINANYFGEGVFGAQ